MLKLLTDQTSYDVSTAGVDVNTSMISLHVVALHSALCVQVCVLI